MNALINIETVTPEKLFVPGEVEKLIAKLEADVRAMPKPDISTESGRDEIKSLAYKIARSKTGLDGLGKDFVAQLKKQSGLIDADRRLIRDRLEALQDEVRKPVTDWETSEQNRIAAHEEALAQIRDAAELPLEYTADVIQERLRLIGRVAQRDWQEFVPQANGALAVAEDKLRAALAVAQKREADAAELKLLQEAEQARIEAEAKAKRQAEAAEAAALAERQRIEQENASAERARLAAEEAAERAVEDERRRVAAKQAADAAAEQKRQANKRHRDKVHREIAADFMGSPHPHNPITQEVADILIDLLVAGKIRHLSVTY